MAPAPTAAAVAAFPARFVHSGWMPKILPASEFARQHLRLLQHRPLPSRNLSLLNSTRLRISSSSTRSSTEDIEHTWALELASKGEIKIGIFSFSFYLMDSSPLWGTSYLVFNQLARSRLPSRFYWNLPRVFLKLSIHQACQNLWFLQLGYIKRCLARWQALAWIFYLFYYASPQVKSATFAFTTKPTKPSEFVHFFFLGHSLSLSTCTA